MQVHFHSQQILGQRQSQQDAVGVLVLSPQRKLYVLADGMGGHQGGEIASQAVLQAMFDAFDDHTADPQQLMQAVQLANHKLRDLMLQQPDLSGMGTTLLAVILDEHTGQFDFVSVGDSPLYHWQNGQLHRINANHAFAEELKKLTHAGVMTASEAAAHPQRHAITSALMGKEIAHIDCGSGCLKHGERLMLASDGVQTLSDDAAGELAQYLGDQYDGLPQMAQHIFQAIEQKNLRTQDNATLLLIELPLVQDDLPAPPIAPMMRSTPLAPPTLVERVAAPVTQVEMPEVAETPVTPIEKTDETPSTTVNNMEVVPTRPNWVGLLIGVILALGVAVAIAIWTRQAKPPVPATAPVATSQNASDVGMASGVASAVSAPQ